MDGDPQDFSVGRPPGITSRLHRVTGSTRVWRSAQGVDIQLPLVLDLVCTDDDGRVQWWVAATVDLPGEEPSLVHLELGSAHGLDIDRLQRDFRWITPLDVVTRLVPQAIIEGTDPFDVDYPIVGYPEVTWRRSHVGRRLSDEFLEDIAREYLAAGRGYARILAASHNVSTRTAASWVEKARQRGILTPTRPGKPGGHLVPRSQREDERLRPG